MNDNPTKHYKGKMYYYEDSREREDEKFKDLIEKYNENYHLNTDEKDVTEDDLILIHDIMKNVIDLLEENKSDSDKEAYIKLKHLTERYDYKDAEKLLGFLYYYGYGTEKDNKKSYKILKQTIEKYGEDSDIDYYLKKIEEKNNIQNVE